ncbi:urease subunit beta [Oceanicella sp. SM1341]|uniref:urease subunit beta n=1 Tax=Oceanicella sp. SM1341 TaxID=1548889 RepID=UPI000E4B97A3|nr:urease subunit beta [Oceanicella sp. SM1341]
MHLTPTEMERLTIFTAAELARRYRGLGIRLSHPEAVALLADEILTAARRGLDHPGLVSLAGTLLGPEEVEPGVPQMLRTFSVEVSMAEGTKLVTVFDPIPPAAEPGPAPGEIIPAEGEIELNAGRPRREIEVLNEGDRTIQVRAHAHFAETNPALKFDRAAAWGMRLDRPSGGGERFDPGVARTVTLVPFGGLRRIHGFAGLAEGGAEETRAAGLRALAEKGYGA